mmetsp:Transcript_24477/g.40817  ORF Transcript_24477/g.40817 Transcript_24477/m.40817 type:complete len:308 (+) Transcript_24477:169-1092(+)|eukprot:CAMPEP_0174982086 /NCGR_PEP_ID=MMETSP0004_2-20121128/16276_1 /TAXON_ID=420556 /ORGANISM="Ochromonas sp., Strain CCMP1393" /LENGTH=307 /DNA_ID=CAMNT_0016233955 /DNA_START=91 /DNA_END=1014 /DNA_ORIENTATION=+
MRESGKKIHFAPKRSTSDVPEASALIGMALAGDMERVSEFVAVHPELVNAKDKDNGNVALHIASSKGNAAMASLLIRHGANVDLQDIFGNSALHYATDKKRDKVVELLINCGADINLRDYRGNTPLHTAAANNDIEIVRMLLLRNADPNIGNLEDLKPMEKTSSQSVKSLIERKIHADSGGAEDEASKLVKFMSFGVGLGVGLGMAIAKQQQFFAEQKLEAELAEAKRRKNKQKHVNIALENSQVDNGDVKGSGLLLENGSLQSSLGKDSSQSRQGSDGSVPKASAGGNHGSRKAPADDGDFPRRLL